MAAGDLCTLDDVRAAMETKDADTDLDGLIAPLISVASRALCDFTQRELAPATASATRRIDVSGYLVDLAPYDLRSVTAMTLDPDVSPVTLAAHVDYELFPIGGDRDGVYPFVRLSNWLSLQTTKMMSFGKADLSIAGAWGFATVPDIAQQACIVAVRSWVRRDVATYASLNPEQRQLQPQAYGTYKLPVAAKDLVSSLMRYPAGSAV